MARSQAPHGGSGAKRTDAAAEDSHDQRILGGALVGLVYEDISRTLLQVPTPDDLLREPDIVAVYHDVRAAQAAPFLEYARRSYTACAQNAVADARFRAWQRYCAVRAQRLPEPRQTGPLPAGETQVTVVPDLVP